jgi:hypothetical protein
MDDDIKASLSKLLELYVKIRSKQAFHGYLLVELLRDVAGNMPDRHAYLSDLFERISARADQLPIESEAHPSLYGVRSAASDFFALVEKACDADKEGENP